MDIARKAVNVYVWYWIWAFVGLGLALMAGGIIHVIKSLMLGRVWI